MCHWDSTSILHPPNPLNKWVFLDSPLLPHFPTQQSLTRGQWLSHKFCPIGSSYDAYEASYSGVCMFSLQMLKVKSRHTRRPAKVPHFRVQSRLEQKQSPLHHLLATAEEDVAQSLRRVNPPLPNFRWRKGYSFGDRQVWGWEHLLAEQLSPKTWVPWASSFLSLKPLQGFQWWGLYETSSWSVVRFIYGTDA